MLFDRECEELKRVILTRPGDTPCRGDATLVRSRTAAMTAADWRLLRSLLLFAVAVGVVRLRTLVLPLPPLRTLDDSHAAPDDIYKA